MDTPWTMHALGLSENGAEARRSRPSQTRGMQALTENSACGVGWAAVPAASSAFRRFQDQGLEVELTGLIWPSS